MKNIIIIVLFTICSLVAKLNAQTTYIVGEPKYNPTKSGMSRQLKDTSGGRWVEYFYDETEKVWFTKGSIVQNLAPPLVSYPATGVTVRNNKKGYITWFSPLVNAKYVPNLAGTAWELEASGGGTITGITAIDTINKWAPVGNYLYPSDTATRHKILTRKAGDSLYVTPSVLATKQNLLTWQEEGVNTGVAGSVTTVNLVGSATATQVGSTLTITVPIVYGEFDNDQHASQNGVPVNAEYRASFTNTMGKVWGDRVQRKF
jgi:hypothetical protein